MKCRTLSRFLLSASLVLGVCAPTFAQVTTPTTPSTPTVPGTPSVPGTPTTTPTVPGTPTTPAVPGTPTTPSVPGSSSVTTPMKDGVKQANDTVKNAMLKNIADTAMADAQLSTLVNALKTAGLVDTLKGPGPLTVFAPTNEAFNKLPAGTLDELMKDKEKLKKVLLYHVVAGKNTSKEVMTMKVAKTMQGSDATIKVEGTTVMIDNAKVTRPDVMASNGVIHIVDTVLMPKM